MERWGFGDLGSRPWVFPALSLGLGAFVGSSTSAWTALFLGAGGVGLLLALVFSRRPGGHLALLVSAGCVGTGLAGWHGRIQLPPSVQAGGTYHLEGVLTALDAEPDGQSAELDVQHVGEAASEPCRFRVRLFLRGEAGPFTLGQRLRVVSALHSLPETLNWGEWDGRAALRARGVLFHAGADASRVVPLSPPSPFRLRLDALRQKLAVATRAHSPSPEAAALYVTLAAGLRAELPDVWEERFARSGLAHILSVSGLHVAALAFVVLYLLRALLVRWTSLSRQVDVRRLAALCALPALWAYVVFTGWQPPAVRSGVMLTVLLLGHAAWRRADALNSLAMAALLLIAVDPSSVHDLSLQLSFLAVISLLVLSPALRAAVPLPRPDPQETRRWRRWLAGTGEAIVQSLCVSVAVTVGSLPLVVGAFHRVSLAGLVANVVCLPLGGVLSALSAGGAAAFAVHPTLALPFLFLGTRACALLLWLVAHFAAWPGAVWNAPSFASFPALALVFVAGWLVFALSRRWARAGAWTAVAALAWVALAPRLRQQDELTVTFLSVGHGDATVLSSGGKTALVDGGGVPGGTDVGARVVLPYLREQGVDGLALAVLSHPHPDHALGLIRALSEVPAARLWLPAGNDDGPLTAGLRATMGSRPVELVERGHPGFWLGSAYVSVLGPPRDRILLEGVNDRSLVVRVQHGEVSFLLTGDVEAAAEEQLASGPVTVLKAPHHGSGTSSTEAFVERVRPRFVVFCVGKENRFHFPYPEVVARYQQAGSHCLRTDLDGAVRFVSDGRDVRVETFRVRSMGDEAKVVDPSGLRAQLGPHAL